ncbi:hypothetical protein P3C80_23625 [Pseudomonas aeruginosa]|uniref:hypothetical protein n=1 Tax=Pseudomonas aeruginosa TaxID=287 RepID=UPI0021F0B41E|nr:hypothetical protein [Pseudomonas aeruginosa]MCV6105122.1 hypothetical protein [Pseudomonas aeruginosa]MDI2202481.1 hypothetical protein [Pseudomonas aeruginosa]MDY1166143.1 hypothetical protein [Pseudomonas aeruginosa]HBO4605229.1 hypothetical protein [Pseudomonas aeruginosa]
MKRLIVAIAISLVALSAQAGKTTEQFIEGCRAATAMGYGGDFKEKEGFPAGLCIGTVTTARSLIKESPGMFNICIPDEVGSGVLIRQVADFGPKLKDLNAGDQPLALVLGIMKGAYPCKETTQ